MPLLKSSRATKTAKKKDTHNKKQQHQNRFLEVVVVVILIVSSYYSDRKWEIKWGGYDCGGWCWKIYFVLLCVYNERFRSVYLFFFFILKWCESVGHVFPSHIENIKTGKKRLFVFISLYQFVFHSFFCHNLLQFHSKQIVHAVYYTKRWAPPANLLSFYVSDILLVSFLPCFAAPNRKNISFP